MLNSLPCGIAGNKVADGEARSVSSVRHKHFTHLPASILNYFFPVTDYVPPHIKKFHAF